MSGNGQASVWLCAFQGFLATLTCGLCCWLCVSFSGCNSVKNQEKQETDKKGNNECSINIENKNSTKLLYSDNILQENVKESESKNIDSSKEKIDERLKTVEEEINEFEKQVLKHLEIEQKKEIENNIKEENQNEIKKCQEESLDTKEKDSEWFHLNNTNNTYVHYLCNKIESEKKIKDNTFIKNSNYEIPDNSKCIKPNLNNCEIRNENYKYGTNVNSESSFFISNDSEITNLHKLQDTMDYLKINTNYDKSFCLNKPQLASSVLNEFMNSQEFNNQNILNISKEIIKDDNISIHENEEKSPIRTIQNFIHEDTFAFTQKNAHIRRSNQYINEQNMNYNDESSKQIYNNYMNNKNNAYLKNSNHSFLTYQLPVLYPKGEMKFSQTHKKHFLNETLEHKKEIERENKKIKTNGIYKKNNINLHDPKYKNVECISNEIVDNIRLSKYTNNMQYNTFVKHSNIHNVSTNDLLPNFYSSNNNKNDNIKSLEMNKQNIRIDPIEHSSMNSSITPLSAYIIKKCQDKKMTVPFDQSKQMSESIRNDVNNNNINKTIYEYLQNSIDEYNEKNEETKENKEIVEKIQDTNIPKQAKIEYISKEWMYKPVPILHNKKIQNSKGGSWCFAQVKLNIDSCEIETESVLNKNKEKYQMQKSMKNENYISNDSFDDMNEPNYQNETLEFEEMLHNIKSEYVDEEETKTEIKKRTNDKIQETKKERNSEKKKKEHNLSYTNNEQETHFQIMENVRRSQRIKSDIEKQNHQISKQSKIQMYVKKEKSIFQRKKPKRENEQHMIKSSISLKKKMETKKSMNHTITKSLDNDIEENSIKGKELLIEICNHHREIDEYRCASGLANFLIQHMDIKKEESFADLLSFILKLKEEYKMTTPDFIETFLIIETINVDILSKYPKKGWLFVIIHYLKNKNIDKNLKTFIKSLRMDNATISNLTASFYIHKKEIQIEEKEVLRVLSILSDVVIRRSSRIKYSSSTHEIIKGQNKDKQNKEEVLGSCWEPIVINESITK